MTPNDLHQFDNMFQVLININSVNFDPMVLKRMKHKQVDDRMQKMYDLLFIRSLHLMIGDLLCSTLLHPQWTCIFDDRALLTIMWWRYFIPFLMVNWILTNQPFRNIGLQFEADPALLLLFRLSNNPALNIGGHKLALIYFSRKTEFSEEFWNLWMYHFWDSKWIKKK